MDFLDPFSCQMHHIAFDKLKSHAPFSLPNKPIDQYPSEVTLGLLRA